MKEISMIIRPEKLEEVKSILDEINCGGMTITTAMGCGAQKGVTGVNEIKGLRQFNKGAQIRIGRVSIALCLDLFISNIKRRIMQDLSGDFF